MTFRTILKSAKKAAIETPKIFFAPLMEEKLAIENEQPSSKLNRTHFGGKFKTGYRRKSDSLTASVKQLNDEQRAALLKALRELDAATAGPHDLLRKHNSRMFSFSTNKRKSY